MRPRDYVKDNFILGSHGPSISGLFCSWHSLSLHVPLVICDTNVSKSSIPSNNFLLNIQVCHANEILLD